MRYLILCLLISACTLESVQTDEPASVSLDELNIDAALKRGMFELEIMVNGNPIVFEETDWMEMQSVIVKYRWDHSELRNFRNEAFRIYQLLDGEWIDRTDNRRKEVEDGEIYRVVHVDVIPTQDWIPRD